MDLTDILFLRDELGEVGLTGSGGVGVFGGVRGSCCCCCWVSVHVEDPRKIEKKELESELRELKALLLLPGLGP